MFSLNTTPQPNIFGLAARGVTGAGNKLWNQIGNLTPEAARGGIMSYMSPYTNAVLNPQLQQLEEQRQRSLNQIGAQASAANAFGGSRHGLVEAMANRDYSRLANETAANLQQQAFQSAGQLRNQDISNLLSSISQLGNVSQLGFGMGQQLQENLWRQGAQRQEMEQRLLDLAKQQFYSDINAPKEGTTYLSNLIKQISPSSTSSTSKGGQEGPSDLEKGIQNAIQIAAMFI